MEIRKCLSWQMRDFIKNLDIKFIIIHFLISRLIIILTIYFTKLLINNKDADFILLLNVDYLKESFVIVSGDTGWYQNVAFRGYELPNETENFQKNWAFFPLFPILYKLISNDLIFSFIIYFSMFISTILMYIIFLKHVNDKIAKSAILLFLYFPFSYSLIALRPEVLLLLLWCAAYLCYRHEKFFWGAIFSFFASLTKPNGFLIFIFPLYFLLTKRMQLSKLQKLLLLMSTLTPFLALSLFSIYIWSITGDLLAWAKIQKAWGSSFLLNPLKQFYELITEPKLISRWGWDAIFFNWIIFFSSIFSAFILHRKGFKDLSLFLLAIILLSFLNFGVWVHGRHISIAFPYFLGLGLALEKYEHLKFIVYLLFVWLLSIFVTYYSLWIRGFLA